MTRIIMIPDDTSIIYTSSSLATETIVQSINSAGLQSNLEVLESLRLTIDPAAMQASNMGDLVLIYSRGQGSARNPGNDSSAYELTFRQQRILADLCEGYTQKEIARRENLSLRTVGVEVAALKRVVPTLASLCRSTRPSTGKK
jgi:DNA-binding NarL/FixJ family response regulator